ncbi:MAG: VCBS repeat-containing protein, partial [Planctomycetales bacterium]|nr:VCBS repeat-containing protein [Planctomycetales bacterium]
MLASVLIFTAGLAGCGRQAAEPPRRQNDRQAENSPQDLAPLVPRPLAKRVDEGPMRFELLSPSVTNVEFVSQWKPQSVRASQGIGATAAMSGVCIGDYDGDGRPDLFLTRPFGGNRLYRNLGGFRFEDVTESAGLAAELEYEAWGSGPTFVDIDNDGDLDLYVCSHRRANRLYINQGGGAFTEQAKAFGLDFSGASVTMAFADYDLDGDLDAYLVTNKLIQNAPTKVGMRGVVRDGRLRITKPYDEIFDTLEKEHGKYVMFPGAQLDHFYKNVNGNFVESTREVLGGYSAEENFFGHAARWFDYDRDGYPDLYVSNDFFGADQLFHNN